MTEDLSVAHTKLVKALRDVLTEGEQSEKGKCEKSQRRAPLAGGTEVTGLSK